MDDRLGDGPPLWEGEQQFHAFLGYALFTAMAAACADPCLFWGRVGGVIDAARQTESVDGVSPHAIDALRRRRAEPGRRGPVRPLRGREGAGHKRLGAKGTSTTSVVPPGAAEPLGAARLSGAAGLGPGFRDERRPAPLLFGALRESGPRLSFADKRWRADSSLRHGVCGPLHVHQRLSPGGRARRALGVSSAWRRGLRRRRLAVSRGRPGQRLPRRAAAVSTPTGRDGLQGADRRPLRVRVGRELLV